MSSKLFFMKKLCENLLDIQILFCGKIQTGIVCKLYDWV